MEARELGWKLDQCFAPAPLSPLLSGALACAARTLGHFTLRGTVVALVPTVPASDRGDFPLTKIIFP